MRTLIGMTAFVLELEKEFVTPTKPFDTIKEFDRILRYANFLKQPLTLGQFVPCDLDGNVLHPPIERLVLGGGYEMRQSEVYEYNEAQSRVFFEGFRIYVKNKTEKFIGTIGYEIYVDCLQAMRVEDISQEGLTLTPTALKQIQ